MTFEIIGKITDVERMAVSSGIRDIEKLREQLGSDRWRKLKDRAIIKMADGATRVEVHWYEANGVGRRRMKIKRFLD